MEKIYENIYVVYSIATIAKFKKEEENCKPANINYRDVRDSTPRVHDEPSTLNRLQV